jgi:hypothetical protein
LVSAPSSSKNLTTVFIGDPSRILSVISVERSSREEKGVWKNSACTIFSCSEDIFTSIFCMEEVPRKIIPSWKISASCTGGDKK